MEGPRRVVVHGLRGQTLPRGYLARDQLWFAEWIPTPKGGSLRGGRRPSLSLRDSALYPMYRQD